MSKPTRLLLPWLLPLLACCGSPVHAADNGVDYQKLGWRSRAEIAALPAGQRPRIAPMCGGAWVTPIPLDTPPSDPNTTPVTAEAANVHYDATGQSLLQGSVMIRQGSREIDADQAEVRELDGQGSFSGNIVILEPGMVMTGQHAIVNFATHETQVERAEFVTTLINAHGRANKVSRDVNGKVQIARSEFSTCDPDHRSWYFVARDIRLDPDSDRGIVHNATLYVNDFPVFYLPYFNFPLDGARKTGLLPPRFGTTNNGGFQFELPIYLNLAANYDATVTPRLISKRGLMAEGEFRYLLPLGGSGVIGGADLPADKLDANHSRKSLYWKHSGQLSDTVSVRSNMNYVSDNAYFTDLGTDFTSANTTFEERTGEANYHKGSVNLLTRVQAYQTIDPTLTDAQHPYARMPELLLTLGAPTPHGWQPSLLAELTDFTRAINDGSGSEINGNRYRFEPGIAYLASSPWGYLRPGAKWRAVGYQLRGDGVAANSRQPEASAPAFSVDSGLVFERDLGSQSQTLEPRAYYRYTPYHSQDSLPVFDTTTSTFSYSQLFRDSRFSGGDRIDDANQLSLGATSRLIDRETGNEQLRASLGEIQYFRNRRVTAPQLGINPVTNQPEVIGNEIATAGVSGLAGEMAAQFNSGWGGSLDALQSADGHHLNQFSIAASYLPKTWDRLLNIGFNLRRQDPTLNQQPLKQTQVSVVRPIRQNWQMLGLWQYDLLRKQTQDLLAGLQYDACCYSVRLVRRMFLTNPNSLTGGAPVRESAWFMEFRLKGLGGLGTSGIDSLLGNNVYGYSQLMQQEEHAYAPAR